MNRTFPRRAILSGLGVLGLVGFLMGSPIARASGQVIPLSEAAGSGGGLTFSQDDLQQLLPQLATDASDLGQGLADAMADVLASQGNPTGLIVGTEMQGALFVGYRKGSGRILFKGQQVSDAQPIYWEAPSIGWDVGASVGRVAILVYGARDFSALRRQFVSVEGSFHMVAGASISYMRDLEQGAGPSPQLAYISVGLGVDGGIAVEALNFSRRDLWLPPVASGQGPGTH